MIHIPFFLPLVISGLAGALWRDHRHSSTPFLRALTLPVPISQIQNIDSDTRPIQAEKSFDDLGELYHYQRVSWYALAFSLSGWWIFPPALLASIPLLSYNAYNFARTLRQTDSASRLSPLTAFEVIGVVGSLVGVRPTMASLMFLFVFGSRNLLLHVQNLAHIDFAPITDTRFAKVWRLQDGVEIEVTLSEVEAGDVLVMHSGDVVLMEGDVIEGEGFVRQYSLQKVMKSVPKQIGDRVFPFTQLESGCLYIRRD